MLNPIIYTEKVISDFLRYQITAYPFADPGLYAQMRSLLNLEETRATPLMKGPYISLSGSFPLRTSLADLVAEGVLHPHLPNIAPFPKVFAHQERAIRAIVSGDTTLVSTGTGSGKTECFLYPIVSRCLQLRDEGADEGIVAVLVYPMNALAEDQLGRLRDLLAGTGISFGMYVGKTPERTADAPGRRLRQGASRAAYRAMVEKARQERDEHAVHPFEERVSREEMRTPGKQPRILLTNVKQLELLLTRQKDVELFDGARLEFLVFDEAHTFGGAAGAETACLIRRLRAFCGKDAGDTVCVATSATIADPERGPEAGRDFASRFFGVPAESVVLVGEEYEPDVWADVRNVPGPLPENPVVHLKNVFDALESGEHEAKLIKAAFQGMTGDSLDEANWRESLYARLAANELVYQLADILKAPRLLSELAGLLGQRVGRTVPEQEVLAWLALGAASQRADRPLLRPVVHAFVRGMSGAVVTFPEGQDRPRLWLSAEDAADESDSDGLFRLPVLTCTTCGQHYFAHHVADFSMKGNAPEGGKAVGDRRVWPPLDAALGGNRVVLLDRLVASDDTDDTGANGSGGPQLPRSVTPLWFCRYCGTLHPGPLAVCDECGRPGDLVTLYAASQRDNAPGYLSMCVACHANGRNLPGGFREPARPVRAVTVSDVHVLAQNMIQHAERRRLLVFADNRQDAAFQAGWMQDHARRFRLRALMDEKIAQGPISIGDLTAHLDDLLESDDDLSRSLVPEVWRVHRKEAEGVRHRDERKRYLRIVVLREVTTGVRQRIGLEPWGRVRVEYAGLAKSLPFITRWAGTLGVASETLIDGVASLLDSIRRSGVLLDREGGIFSRFWQEGDYEIQRGYLPLMPGIPKGLKLRREAGDDQNRITQWLSDRGDTSARQAARRWGVPRELVPEFLQELWELLADDLRILDAVTLRGSRGKALRGCAGARQIDADKLRLVAHRGVYRCTTCRRAHTRPTPNMACMGWRCDGTIQFEEESGDDYDLMVLDQHFTMVRPREHSAQVPSNERELLERIFKSDSEFLNTLVCTPTLELGVDIGTLDAVLMRNVPPLPANYWQRAGRAGRRERMAVNLTYARPASHDRSYYSDPIKLLGGIISPPRFNLRNELMVRKHVHAAVLTGLQQLARSGDGLTGGDRDEIRSVLDECFPLQVKSYLFDNAGRVRTAPLDVTPLTALAHKHESAVLDHVHSAFTQGWPEKDAAVVAEDALRGYILGMGERLAEVVTKLDRRLRWAMSQMSRLQGVQQQKGTLDAEEESLYHRCDRLIKKLKGIQTRRRREAEGYDDTNTFGVLAAEGFLPGYGLDTGSVLGTAQMPLRSPGVPEFDLPRPPAVALREYAPGNLIYANGNRFVPRFYHLEPVDATLFQVDITNEAIVEAGTAGNGMGPGLGASVLRAVPMCDVDLLHQSHITDEEDYRFQLAVSVIGYEQERHGGGESFAWGTKSVLLRQNVYLRLVNVGAANLVCSNGSLGYPVCLVCGQSRSPLASQADRDAFADDHRERCGQAVEPTGFFADVVADALCILSCENRDEAYSVAEALRIGAARVLDMELDDLQVMAIAHPGQQNVDVLLYDPMPGGSGLLEQMVARWGEVVGQALQVCQNCPSVCETACVDCLYTFRNAFYHRHLHRQLAAKRLAEWGDVLDFQHEVPPKLGGTEATQDEQPVNAVEDILRAMLKRAGFPDPIPQKEIDLGKPLGSTWPDFFYEDPSGRLEGICIYLDGMSKHIHGNRATQQRDREIREILRNEMYEVIPIPRGDLDDPGAMAAHFYRLGRLLLGRERAAELRDNRAWHETPKTTNDATSEALVYCDETCQEIARACEGAGLPDPEVGYELEDGSGEICGQVELAWPDHRVAVVLAEQADCRPTLESEGWVVLDAETVKADPSVLFAHLKG